MESIRDLPELMQRLGRRFTFSLHLPQLKNPKKQFDSPGKYIYISK